MLCCDSQQPHSLVVFAEEEQNLGDGATQDATYNEVSFILAVVDLLRILHVNTFLAVPGFWT